MPSPFDRPRGPRAESRGAASASRDVRFLDPAVIARLNAECEKALADKAVRDALFKAATEPVGGDTERLAKLARSDSEKYARIVKEVNIKLN